MRIVAADVGGTKTLVALYAGEPGAFVLEREARYDSADFSGISAILTTFAGDVIREVHAAALAVAGPVIDRACRTTNLPWHLEAHALERDLSIDRVELLNDFEAVALGIGELAAHELLVLQDRPIDALAPAAVLGAGTGLGEAILVPSSAPGGLPRVLPSEGGHCDLAPRDATEMALLSWLMQKHEHVSYERVVSGPGLEALYEFVISSGLASSSAELAQRLSSAEDRAAVIGSAALDGSDAACARAMDLFLSIYGAEAGNLALKTLPLGGLYVAGGIAPKIIELLRRGPFLRAFRAKGRMEPVLDRVRVSIVLNPRVGLLGARRVAASIARIA